MIETIKVSSRGQIVIPEAIRKHLGIKEGMRLVIIEKNDRIILEPENLFLDKLKDIDKEDLGWLLITEKSLAKDWDNEYDKRWDDVL